MTRRDPNPRRGRTTARRLSTSAWVEVLEGRQLLAVTLAVTTLPVSAVTGTSAVLNGTVTPDGNPTETFFRFSRQSNLTPEDTVLAGGGRDIGADGTGAAAQFDAPQGIAVDAAGNTYVADTGNDTIRKITPGGVVTTLAGSALRTGTADGTGAAARFNGPIGVAVDKAGDVYVADQANQTVRKITPSGQVTTLAGSPGVRGAADGNGSSARFNGPTGIAVDAVGNVYVTDQGNGTIREISPGGDVTTIVGTPYNPGSADGTGAAASFVAPQGLAIDSKGNLYVADSGNDEIREITPLRVVTTLAGSPGQRGSTNGVGPAAQFDAPQALTVDASGNVFVADTSNNLIREINPLGIVTTSPVFASGLNSPAGLALAPSGDLIVADASVGVIREQARFSIEAQPVSVGTFAAPKPQDIVSGTTPIPVSATLTGLTPGTTYYYQTRAISANAFGSGALLTFTTTAQTSSPVGTVTTLSSLTNPSDVSQPITFTARVAAGQGTPTGSVTFMEGSNVLGKSLIDLGSATLTTSTLGVGPHTITAVYSGDTDFSASTSAPLSESVLRNYDRTLVSSSANPAVVGQVVRFTAQVTGPVVATFGAESAGKISASATTTPADDTITFTIDGVDRAAVPVKLTNGNGTATFDTSTLTAGTHTVIASFSGDADYIPSVSAPFAETVNATLTRSPTTVLTIAPISFTLGTPGGIQVGVSPPEGVSGQPAGTIRLTIDGKTGPAIAFTGTYTSVPLPVLTAGTHYVVVSYSGDPNFGPSQSAAIRLKVDPDSTSTRLTVSPNPSAAGQPVTLSAGVSPNAQGPITISAAAKGVHPEQTLPAGFPPVAGDVTFRDGPRVLAVVPVKAGGAATLTTTALTPGRHVFTATFSGDSNYLASTSAQVAEAVTAGSPSVILVRRYGYHTMPTTLVIALSGPLDPATATKLSTYRITDAHGQPILVGRAAYDAVNDFVTLYPLTPLDLHKRYTLTAVGLGRAGANYVTTVDAANLVVTNPFADGASAALSLAARIRARDGR